MPHVRRDDDLSLREDARGAVFSEFQLLAQPGGFHDEGKDQGWLVVAAAFRVFDPGVQTDRPLRCKHAIVCADAEIAVASAKLEKELVLGVSVGDKRTANEVHRCAPETSLQNPDRLVSINSYCRHTQYFSSWNGLRMTLAGFHEYKNKTLRQAVKSCGK